MRILEELGFIKIKPGSAGSISSVLMINPYHAIFDLRKKGRAGVREDKYNALMARSIEIGATDLDSYEMRLEELRKKPRSSYDDLDDEIPF
jgi:hypothetical protein